MEEEITHLNETKWLKIKATTCNPYMATPVILSLSNVSYDTNSPHLVMPSSEISKFCHIYINGTGSNPTEKNQTTW